MEYLPWTFGYGPTPTWQRALHRTPVRAWPRSPNGVGASRLIHLADCSVSKCKRLLYELAESCVTSTCWNADCIDRLAERIISESVRRGRGGGRPPRSLLS